MPYRFARQRTGYADLASGRVLYSLPGHPAFPIRLASEVFQRCLNEREAAGGYGRHSLYDPCCGAAYHLSTLAYLHWNSIREIVGSDIDPRAVQVASRNLGLLIIAGLDRRIGELAALHQQYGKDSHQAALRSAHTLRGRVAALASDHPIAARVFQANALEAEALPPHLPGARVDIVLTDVPYGRHSDWQRSGPQAGNPVGALLDSLLGVLHPASAVAIVSDKQQKISHESYERLDRFHIGRRQAVILRPML